MHAQMCFAIGFVCSFFTIFDLPVFWPVLVMYWIILFALTSKCLLLVGSIGERKLMLCAVRRQIRHMIKYRYVPFTVGKTKYGAK